ncbi:hypothetical protein BDV25DRAFT_143699 [Aspergillus avenaceus]|uniref:Zn(2)-C6 fungal-type domain-containing protein n=1 Tax=Aspergillus avenaceus TaxID=36643 RepID=A0A5N6TJZ7_ASPAV|nr:hypothetical protein BDV25DRAFT_143699 [Aspergillus avenaceus]
MDPTEQALGQDNPDGGNNEGHTEDVTHPRLSPDPEQPVQEHIPLTETSPDTPLEPSSEFAEAFEDPSRSAHPEQETSSDFDPVNAELPNIHLDTGITPIPETDEGSSIPIAPEETVESAVSGSPDNGADAPNIVSTEAQAETFTATEGVVATNDTAGPVTEAAETAVNDATGRPVRLTKTVRIRKLRKSKNKKGDHTSSQKEPNWTEWYLREVAQRKEKLWADQLQRERDLEAERQRKRDLGEPVEEPAKKKKRTTPLTRTVEACVRCRTLKIRCDDNDGMCASCVAANQKHCYSINRNTSTSRDRAAFNIVEQKLKILEEEHKGTLRELQERDAQLRERDNELAKARSENRALSAQLESSRTPPPANQSAPMGGYGMSPSTTVLPSTTAFARNPQPQAPHPGSYMGNKFYPGSELQTQTYSQQSSTAYGAYNQPTSTYRSTSQYQGVQLPHPQTTQPQYNFTTALAPSIPAQTTYYSQQPYTSSSLWTQAPSQPMPQRPETTYYPPSNSSNYCSQQQRYHPAVPQYSTQQLSDTLPPLQGLSQDPITGQSQPQPQPQPQPPSINAG